MYDKGENAGKRYTKGEDPRHSGKDAEPNGKDSGQEKLNPDQQPRKSHEAGASPKPAKARRDRKPRSRPNLKYFFAKLIGMLILAPAAYEAGYFMLALWLGVVILLLVTTFKTD